MQKAATKGVLNWLRREARRGVTIGGLCTGAYTLAKAGLLDGKRATIHWENQDSFSEEFEEVKLTKSVFVMDGNRWSTAGGTSSIDLMLKVIASDHGEDLANTVADQLIYSSIRIAGGEPDAVNTPDEAVSGGIPQLDPAEGDRVAFVDLKQGGRAVRLETGPLGEAFKVLNQCTLDLLRDWGLDPEQHLTATSLPRWINQAALTRKIVSDYPSAAYSQGEQAILRMRVIVNEQGTVESCTILKATDTERLESPACRVMQGARFEPARDAAGQPFRSLYVTSITYKIG